MKGRLRYDEKEDSFVYEILGSNGKWGMCQKAKCVRREGAEDGEDANYVHYSILKRIVNDAELYDMELHNA